MNRFLRFMAVAWLCANGLFSQEAGKDIPKSKRVSHAFYIISNVGNAPLSEAEAIIGAINEKSKQNDEATLLIIGNIVTKDGFPSQNEDQGREKARLEKLMQLWDNFNGKVVLTPGKNEWAKGAPKSIDELESFLQDNSKAEFWPSDGCPLERETINDEVVLEMVDSQWFLEDWDDHPYVNGKCEHKTRDAFLAEFKDDIKDSQGKTVVVAVYQPVMSNTQICVIDGMGGFAPGSYQNGQNRWFRSRLATIAAQFEDVIFVSGKDRNLQYMSDNGIPQIISGAIGKTQKARAPKDEHFEADRPGYARLTIYKNGSSEVELFTLKNDTSQILYSQEIPRERPSLTEISVPRKTDDITAKASIYTPEETDKSSFFEWLWGDRYRSLYSKKITAPVLHLDELPNQIRPISEGGGTQSKSLRLVDNNGHEYTLRALRKSAVRFLQATVIKDHFIEDYLKNTVAERILLDFYTTSHPYAQFAMPELSEALNIPHANPEIYYLPKQERLGIYNEDYGNALFMLEEHIGDENKNFASFGSPDDILSTADLRLELLESKDAFVDESSYIKARLLDHLTGNWDRHQDQWRWAKYETERGKSRFEPIPRDWDQVFPKYDGSVIAVLKLAFPELRKMQDYDAKIKNIKWFNLSGYPLDKMFIKTSNWQDWKEQVDYIRQNLTDRAIDSAFATLPEAAQDSSIAGIKKNLRARRDDLENIARRYYEYLARFEVITGTGDDDQFLIHRRSNGITEIAILKDGDSIFKNSYDAKKTREMWVYGLDGNDTFKTWGDGDNPMNIKVVGGEENDSYDFRNLENIKLYDYRSEDNTIVNPKTKKWLTDSYDINNYDYQKRKYSQNIVLPSVGYDGDTGFRIGVKDRFRTYGLANHPFSSQHTLGAEYFFATNGFAVQYTPEFAHIFYKWNLGVDLRYASPNFTMNYFGEGNGSPYDREETDRDFNRVRIRRWSVSPYLIHTDSGSSFTLRTQLESNDVSEDEGRFVGQAFSPENDVFDTQRYASAEIGYTYVNENNSAFPTRGMKLNVVAGYTANLKGNGNRFGYIKPSLSLLYPMVPNETVVLATNVAGESLLGDSYEFYHGALLGGNHTVRGYRNERFNGKTSFYHSTDLRVALSSFRTNFIPLQIGISAGFDYGRVWAEDGTSEKWHNNVGGSVWVSGFSAVTGNLGYYHGAEGGRLLFSLGFNF